MFCRVFATAVLAAGLLLCAIETAAAQQSRGLKDNLALGNPSDAESNLKTHPDNFLMDKELFALSFNNKLGTPNWVSWRLVKDDFGDIERDKNPFHPDKDLPKEMRVLPKDYDLSGFDQGHVCPNGDRDVDEDTAAKTFVMSNMMPQSSVLNRQSWRLLEAQCQKLAESGKELYIIAGPNGKGGHGEVVTRKKVEGKGKIVDKKSVFKSFIGTDDRVTVPAQCWKVILILDKPGEGPAAKRVTDKAEVIAVIMANDMTAKKWQDHQVSIAEVEKLTNLKFFKDIDEDVRNALRTRPPAQARGVEPASPFYARGIGELFPLMPPQRFALYHRRIMHGDL